MISLWLGVHYTHTGKYLSHLMLLKDQRHGNILHVVADTKEQKKYVALAADLNIDYIPLQRYSELLSLHHGTDKNCIFSLEIDFLQKYVDSKNLENSLHISLWDEQDPQIYIETLLTLGYEFHEYGKACSYRKIWDHIRIIHADGQESEIHFWGNTVESLSHHGSSVSEISISSCLYLDFCEKGISLFEYIHSHNIVFVLDSLQFHESYNDSCQADHCISFDILSSPKYASQKLDIAWISCNSLEELKSILSHKKPSVIYTRLGKTLSSFLENNNFQHIPIFHIHSGVAESFATEFQNYICDDILARIFVKKRSKKKLSWDIDLLLKIQKGDYIVHIDHGIGVFVWITQRDLSGIKKDYLELSYKNEDKLFVPIHEVGRVTKYVGNEHPTLSPLSWKIWERKMQKVHEDIQYIAQNILENFAERKIRKGAACIYNSEKIHAFQSLFPYKYTLDQEQCIWEVFQNMQSENNMDRLLVGDVGFWKTEIAFNAAYLAMENHKQVFFLSPLVVLAHEHYEKALERFEGSGYKIALLTRLQSHRECSEIIKDLEEGNIHMLIGTHRLLSEKIRMKNLGLLIVDEEHKFGVWDKEKIKSIKSEIDILSLSATPIPRSLHLALSGVRDISLLKTPPSGRKSIETSVLEYNEQVIFEAGKREFARWGQIFFVHNRVQNIEVIQKRLESIFPKKSIVITHGQLPGEELEMRILDFKEQKYDILLSTTVIENGIDFPNVNTIFIHECERFWISQIHQLRWRVWRSDRQGYCYMLYKNNALDIDAGKRLQTLVDYSYLWAGFELAMKDLEVRWGGDILWIRQSGKAQEIGISLFLKMLEEKIEELQQKKSTPQNTPKTPLVSLQKVRILLDIETLWGADVFYSDTDKLQFYRELELISTKEDIDYLELKTIWESENWSESSSLKNIFRLLRLKYDVSLFHILQIKKVWDSYQIDFHPESTLEDLRDFLMHDTQTYFRVITPHRIRACKKDFANDQLFIEYLSSFSRRPSRCSTRE